MSTTTSPAETGRVGLAAYKDLCIDAVDPTVLGRFWAAALDLRWEPDAAGDGRLTGATPRHTIWVNRVPEPRTVKHRVHLDVYTRAVADLASLGARVLEPPGDRRAWTVMADPEAGEFCAFLRDPLPPDRLHGLVVDCADPPRLAEWWAKVYGCDVVHWAGGSTLENVPGMPILTMDFVPVPEPKTVKNRVHWDVTAPEPAALVAAGATVLRRPGGDIGWTVMADPAGNEFCVFPPPQ